MQEKFEAEEPKRTTTLVKLTILMVYILLFSVGCQVLFPIPEYKPRRPLPVTKPVSSPIVELEPSWGITMRDGNGMILVAVTITPIAEPQNLPALTAEDIREAETALDKSIEYLRTEFMRGKTVIITLYQRRDSVTHKIYVADLYQENQRILGYSEVK